MNSETRVIKLDTVLNVRDLGGIKTTTGQSVKPGRLVRGARPDRISEDDLSLLVNELGVSTFLDIRGPAQFDEAVNPEFEHQGITRVNSPLSDSHRTSATEAVSVIEMIEAGIPADYFAAYTRWLGLNDRFASVLSSIADSGGGGTFMHCTAGKDRTGMVVAVALSTVGVHRDEVVADYAMSRESTDALLIDILHPSERFQKISETADPDLIRSFVDAPPEAMESVLGFIDREYGSSRNYVLGLPNGPSIVENLERKLLA